MLLIFGSFISGLGSSIYFIAITFYILEKFKDPLLFGIIMTAGTLPQLLFGFFAGQIIDSLNKRKIIILADIFRGLLMLSLLVLIHYDKLTSNVLILISFIFSTIGVFFRPSIAAIIPLLVKDKALNKVNSILHGSGNITVVLGPILGGVAYTKLGIQAVILINGISYIASGISEFFINYKKEKRKEKKKNISILKEVTSGISIIFSSDMLKKMIIFTLITNFFFISFFELIFPYLVKIELNQNAFFYGRMSTMRAIGTILGASLVFMIPEPKNFFKRYIKLVSVQGFILIVIGLIPFLFKLNKDIIYTLYLALLLVGIISTTLSIPFDVMIQKNSPSGKIGTVYSTMSSLFRLLAPVSLFCYGILMKYFKSSYLSLINGVSIIILSILLTLLIKKQKN